MAQYGYSIKDMNETRAHACLRDVAISYKVACMVGKRIKGLPAQRAINFLRNVQTMKVAVPYTKFNDSVGHKPGIGPGRYPIKAAKLFEQLLANAMANAEDKGLGSELIVEFVVAQQASRPFHNGRQGRRQFKRSHVELVVTNAGVPQEEKKETRPARKAAAKKAAAAETEAKKSTEAKEVVAEVSN